MTIALRYNTASQEIPLGHFLDSTDGNTEETGLTIANTDIKLWKAGATTLANKNSGGATHIAKGVYYAVLDATDTDTVGPMVCFVHVTGATVVRLDTVVYPQAVYDALIAGSGTLGVLLADGAHGGSASTLTLKRLLVANPTNGQTAVDISASGTGNAHALRIDASGGGKGVAIAAASIGVSVDSSGAKAISIQGGTDSDGVQIAGNGTGVDLRANVTGDLNGTVATVTNLTNLPAITADWLTAAGLDASAATEIANAVKAAVVEAQGSYTIQQVLSILLAACAGATTDGGATLQTPNGAATRIAATINASNERTGMTLTPSA